MKSYVYILKNLKTGEYYIGSSEQPAKRLEEHNAGKVYATKYKRPYIQVLVQSFENNEKARKMEAKLKKWKRKDFIDKIVKDGEIKTV